MTGATGFVFMANNWGGPLVIPGHAAEAGLYEDRHTAGPKVIERLIETMKRNAVGRLLRAHIMGNQVRPSGGQMGIPVARQVDEQVRLGRRLQIPQPLLQPALLRVEDVVELGLGGLLVRCAA